MHEAAPWHALHWQVVHYGLRHQLVCCATVQCLCRAPCLPWTSYFLNSLKTADSICLCCQTVLVCRLQSLDVQAILNPAKKEPEYHHIHMFTAPGIADEEEISMYRMPSALHRHYITLHALSTMLKSTRH